MTVWWCALVGYAIGSLPVGYAVARYAGDVDLRREGSGNVGATNAYRTSGLALGLVVLTADVAKGAASVLLSDNGSAAIVAGVAAVVGHVYPVWLGFRGGKGVATAAGAFALLAPWPTAISALAFGVTVAATRYVSLGSVVAATLLSAAVWWSPGPRGLGIGSTIVTALILVRHWENLVRLWSRTERALGT